MSKRVLVLSDSLALPREKPEVTKYEDAWPALLAKSGYEIHQVSIGGATSEDLLKQCSYHLSFRPEIVIIQVGIVDCAPRFMTQFEIACCRRIPIIGKFFIKLLNRKLIKRIRKVTYVKLERFERNIQKMYSSFTEARVLLIGILPGSDEYEGQVPGVKKNIEKYNAVIRHRYNGYIDVSDIDRSGIMSDFHHLNTYGHKCIYEKIMKVLNA